jgi:hypothetical protein
MSSIYTLEPVTYPQYLTEGGFDILDLEMISSRMCHEGVFQRIKPQGCAWYTTACRTERMFYKQCNAKHTSNLDPISLSHCAKFRVRPCRLRAAFEAALSFVQVDAELVYIFAWLISLLFRQARSRGLIPEVSSNPLTGLTPAALVRVCYCPALRITSWFIRLVK